MIYEHLCENYDYLHAAGGYLHKNYDDLHKNYDHLHVLAVHLRYTLVLFTPKEHLPKPVQVNGVTPEVLIFSAETLVV